MDISSKGCLMFKLKIVKEEDGTFFLSDKVKVLEAYYSYKNEDYKHCEKTFFSQFIDDCGDLTRSVLHNWIYPEQVQKHQSVKKDDAELLKSIMKKSKYVSLVSNMNCLIYSIGDVRKKEKAIEEAQKVSECAKQIIIQEYLDSLTKQQFVA